MKHDLLHPTLMVCGGDIGSSVSVPASRAEEGVLSPSIVEMMEGTDDLEWVFDIACRYLSLDEFFTKPGSSISSETLKLCQGCRVREDCTKHAYSRDIDFGYFGGLSPAFRRDHDLEESLVFIRTGVDTKEPKKSSRKKRK